MHHQDNEAGTAGGCEAEADDEDGAAGGRGSPGRAAQRSSASGQAQAAGGGAAPKLGGDAGALLELDSFGRHED